MCDYVMDNRASICHEPTRAYTLLLKSRGAQIFTANQVLLEALRAGSKVIIICSLNLSVIGRPPSLKSKLEVVTYRHQTKNPSPIFYIQQKSHTDIQMKLSDLDQEKQNRKLAIFRRNLKRDLFTNAGKIAQRKIQENVVFVYHFPLSKIDGAS